MAKHLSIILIEWNDKYLLSYNFLFRDFVLGLSLGTELDYVFKF